LNFTVYAQAASQSPIGGSWQSLIPILLMIVIFYFLLIRPQQKKEKDRKNMINTLQKGDKVVTVGGIYGVVTGVKDGEDIVVLKVSENTKIEFTRSAIQNKVVEKTQDTKEKKEKKDEKSAG